MTTTRFQDRQEAGEALAVALQKKVGRNAVVVGIPRGGAEVAFTIAEALGIDFDVMVSRKIPHPHDSTLVLGAMAEGGQVRWRADVHQLDVDEGQKRHARSTAEADLRLHAGIYRRDEPRRSLKGREVILVDDGVHTGVTLLAAADCLAAEACDRVVVAIPGGPERTVKAICEERLIDDVIVLKEPEDLTAVRDLYASFSEVSADQVLAWMRHFRDRRQAKDGGAGMALA